MTMIYFGSNTKELFPLSNFSHAPIKVSKETLDESWIELNPDLGSFFLENEEMTFPSIEHLWHAFKATDRETFLQFSSAGRFGKTDISGFQAVFPLCDAEQKRAFWMAKKNVGIVAKMAADKKRGKRHLGISGKMKYERERPEPKMERKIWLALLARKYQQNETHRDLLKKTRGKKLVEFARQAAQAKTTEHWGGCVVDGVLRGENVMGQYMEEIRDKLISEEK